MKGRNFGIFFFEAETILFVTERIQKAAAN